MAILVNELRIGNWVKIVETSTCVICIFETSCELLIGSRKRSTSLFEVEPIPLTPEILEKCGFEEEYKSEFTIRYTHKEKAQIGYDWNKSFGWRTRFLGEHFKHIHYLHQLQNLYFALTGEELKVNL